MDGLRETLDLWDYRRRVQEIYRAVREGPPTEDTWRRWVADRDELFGAHSQSAIEPERRASFSGLPYFPHDPAWRFEAEVEPAPEERLGLPGEEDEVAFRRFGAVRFEVAGGEASLSLFWLLGYGGGVFLPFRDATSGSETYGGGRYLLDTVKGADLGTVEGRVVLDFNYAYHPSCVHSDRWSCPLAPPENRLAVPVRAGERLPSTGRPKGG